MAVATEETDQEKIGKLGPGSLAALLILIVAIVLFFKLRDKINDEPPVTETTTAAGMTQGEGEVADRESLEPIEKPVPPGPGGVSIADGVRRGQTRVASGQTVAELHRAEARRRAARNKKRKEARKEIDQYWSYSLEGLHNGFRDYSSLEGWREQSSETALRTAEGQLQSARQSIQVTDVLHVDLPTEAHRAIDAGSVALQSGAQLARKLEAHYGPTWNAWTTVQTGKNPVYSLELGDSNYLVHFDLAPVAYKDLFPDQDIGSAPLDPALVERLPESTIEGNKVLIDVHPLILGSAISLGANAAKTVEIDLGRVYANEERHKKITAEVRAAKTPSDIPVEIPAAQIKLAIKPEKIGCATLMVALTMHDRVKPLDNLVLNIEVAKPGEATGTCRAPRIDATAFSAGLRTLLFAGAGIDAEAALYTVDLQAGDKINTAIWWIEEGRPALAWDNDGTLAALLTRPEALEKAMDKAFENTVPASKRPPGSPPMPDYSEIAEGLGESVFFGEPGQHLVTAEEAKTRFFELASKAEAASEAATLLVVRVNASKHIELSPLQLLAAPGENWPVASGLRVVQPLQGEDLREAGACFEFPAVGVSPRFFEAQAKQEPSKLPGWLHQEEGSIQGVIDYLKEQPNTPRGEVFVLLAHHGDGEVWYPADSDGAAVGSSRDDQEPVIKRHHLRRDFNPGSVALLATCNAGSWLELDAWFARALGRQKMQALAASPFRLDEKYGRALALGFAKELEKARGEAEPPTFGELVDRAANYAAQEKEKLSKGNDYRAVRHALVLAGNPDLELCPKGEGP